MNYLEFRLYYGDYGEVLFYTCEKPEGKYLIIDKNTYLECRFDIKVVDEKIEKIIYKTTVSKLVPNNEGINCHKDDVSIIYNGKESQKWKLKYVEYD